MMDLADAFSGLPYFDGASMSVNTSEICATRKILQCRDFGLYMADISRKFQRDSIPDLPDDHFKERKRAYEDVQRWVDQHMDKQPFLVYKNEWVPILYNFEPARNSAKRNQDWGHLVFADCTLTRYLLVMCFGPDNDGHGKNAHEEYLALTKYHADRLMSILKYVFHDAPNPAWVRATYTTFSSSIPPQFLDSIDENVPTDIFPPIYHTTPKAVTPFLTESELERIDSTFMQSKSWSKRMPPASMRASVLAHQPRPRPLHSTWLCGKSAPESCGFCGQTASTKMPQCAKCKIVRYCNKECQRAHWTSHRKYCRNPETVSAK